MPKHRLPVFDADGHVWENDDEIAGYFEGADAERQRFPTFGLFPSLDGWTRGLVAPDMDPFTNAKSWGTMLDELGADGTVLYPTSGLAHGLIQNPEWAVSTATAYNSWLEDRYTVQDRRLFAAGLMSVQDPAAAVKEMRRCHEQRTSFVAMILPSVTNTGRTYGDPIFLPIFEEAERLGIALVLHGAPSRGMGFDHFQPFIKVHTLEHPIPLFIQMTDMMFSGVFEEFPGLRVGFLEAGSSWVPWIMDRMDYEYGWMGHQAPKLKRRPSEYLRDGEQFWVSAELDEVGLKYTIDAIGADRVLYPSDYPHERAHDEFAKDIPEFLEDPRFDDNTKRKILHDNAKTFYRIK